MIYYYAAYMLVMNLLGYILMAVDKALSKRRARRIPESVLLGMAVVGGPLGVHLGMVHCRHKTRHLSFKVFVPAMLFTHIALGYLAVYQMLK